MHLLNRYLPEAVLTVLTRFPCRPVGPVMLVSSQLESAYVGQRSKKLQCETEAFPRSINYWTNEGGEMITAGTLFPLTAEGESDEHLPSGEIDREREGQ